MRMPLFKTVFGGLFSTWYSQGAKFNEETLLAGADGLGGKTSVGGLFDGYNRGLVKRSETQQGGAIRDWPMPREPQTKIPYPLRTSRHGESDPQAEDDQPANGLCA